MIGHEGPPMVYTAQQPQAAPGAESPVTFDANGQPVLTPKESATICMGLMQSNPELVRVGRHDYNVARGKNGHSVTTLRTTIRTQDTQHGEESVTVVNDADGSKKTYNLQTPPCSTYVDGVLVVTPVKQDSKGRLHAASRVSSSLGGIVGRPITSHPKFTLNRPINCGDKVAVRTDLTVLTTKDGIAAGLPERPAQVTKATPPLTITIIDRHHKVVEC
jgi:hypothetical protein